MADEMKVYLDHLIPRMNLRYKRSTEELATRGRSNQPEDIPISDLDSGEFRANLLRKPDFQRATTAWSPQDCVSLLDSVINRQVIPSIIMWNSSDNGHEYVLDGGHRISVVMAWIRNDWGEKLPPEIADMMDEERLEEVKKAAREVSNLVKGTVGSIEQYKQDYDEFDRIIKAKGSPGQEMDDANFKRALFYSDFRRRAIKFNVQWVEGDYEIAERSFIKINKSGRQLTTWEIKLIENRNSSFARAIMSITSLDSLPHYWPAKIYGQDENSETISKIDYITNGLYTINQTLFNPPYQPQNIQLKQPLMTFFGQDADKKPYWVAELLTVLERGQGSSVETEKLLAKGNSDSPEKLIDNGYTLVENALQCFDHLIGRTPRSLGIVSSVYFYTRSVRYVRSLLYGFIHWLLSGDEQEILTRKRIFSGHRAAFEKILLLHRDDFSSGLGRKSGSGSEVTTQTARYYQEVLKLLIKHQDAIESTAFTADYEKLLVEKFEIDKKQTTGVSKSRNFTQTQKAAKRMETLIETAPRCEICGGIFDPAEPSGYLQHDHKLEVFRGGQTRSDNQRLVHNFCNNQTNRETIQAIRAGQKTIPLPEFFQDVEIGVRQLNFFDDEWFMADMSRH